MVGLNIHKSKYCKEEEKMVVGMVESQSYDGGVLCCAASDIEIKGQVSHFQMHFRDFGYFC